MGIAVDSSGNVYAADNGNNCIKIYRPAPGDDDQIELDAGWNLISFPLHPLDTDIDSVLSSIQGGYDSAWEYRKNPEWLWYLPGNPSASNLRKVESGIGYWISINQPGMLTVHGMQPATAIPMNTGWNLAGYSSQTSESIENCMASIEGKYNSVWGYDPVQGWSWYFPGVPEISNLWRMDPWKGYWIEVKEDCIWDISIIAP